VKARDSLFDAEHGGTDLTIFGRDGAADVDILDGEQVDTVNLDVGNQASGGFSGAVDVLVSGVYNDGAPMSSRLNVRGSMDVGGSIAPA
jgi:hypothetical protein